MFGKKKIKVTTSDVLDSLQFPFTLVEEEVGLFKCNKEKNINFSTGNKECKLTPFFIKDNLNNSPDETSYILILKEFLKYSKEFSAKKWDLLSEDSFVEYTVVSVYDNYVYTLSYRDSDMYKSVSQYITNNALEYIYKNATRGNR